MLSYWERYVIKNQNTDCRYHSCNMATMLYYINYNGRRIWQLVQAATSFLLTSMAYNHFCNDFGYIIVMTTVPFLLRLIPPKINSKKDIELFLKTVSAISQLITSNSKILAISLIFTIAFSQALWKSETETSFISVFFNKEHPCKKM